MSEICGCADEILENIIAKIVNMPQKYVHVHWIGCGRVSCCIVLEALGMLQGYPLSDNVTCTPWLVEYLQKRVDKTIH